MKIKEVLCKTQGKPRDHSPQATHLVLVQVVTSFSYQQKQTVCTTGECVLKPGLRLTGTHKVLSVWALISSTVTGKWFCCKICKRHTFSAEVQLSQNTKSPLELSMCSDQRKLILNHLHAQDPFCRFCAAKF